MLDFQAILESIQKNATEAPDKGAVATYIPELAILVRITSEFIYALPMVKVMVQAILINPFPYRVFLKFWHYLKPCR
ncbi:hypothetical protein [Algibacter lectus]|uniref:Uncharacterized protein n=1 Tax=Algibacter lectus TaxID=221126 RepID=A0A090W286_9FLAO|nr:hypothetical protein JCM19300_1475 [Algibacter lectus]